MTVTISMDESTLTDVQRHLFPKGDRREQGGFLFTRFDEGKQTFVVMEWMPLVESDYFYQERDYLEMSDLTRGSLIKKAHDLQASLVEIHCHPGQHKAEFSLADWMGFSSFVPHIRWRLANRPYAALVFGHQSVDGFAWIDDVKLPIGVTGIVAGDFIHRTTGESIKRLKGGQYE